MVLGESSSEGAASGTGLSTLGDLACARGNAASSSDVSVLGKSLLAPPLFILLSSQKSSELGSVSETGDDRLGPVFSPSPPPSGSKDRAFDPLPGLLQEGGGKDKFPRLRDPALFTGED